MAQTEIFPPRLKNFGATVPPRDRERGMHWTGWVLRQRERGTAVSRKEIDNDGLSKRDR